MKQFKHLLLLTLLSLCSVTSQAYEVTIDMIKYRTDSGDTTAYVYFYTSGITEAKIRSSITYNGKQIPVTSIGKFAFEGCTSLTSVTIPNSVTSIGSDAFRECTSLTSVTIPNSVTSIGERAFDGCTSLTSVEYNAVDCKGLKSYSHVWFRGCPLTSLKIGNEVKSIPAYLAYKQSNLTSVTIGNSVTAIGEWAFNGCSSLTSVTIPNSVTSIGSSAFEGCSKLSSVTIPNSVTSIGSSAFCYCSSLTSVTIPNSVTSIGDYAFSGCSGLTSVTIPNSVTSIGNSAFRNCSSLTSVEYNAVDCKGPSSYESDAWFKDCPLTSLKIGNEVKSIPAFFAYGVSKLTQISIPSSVENIGNYAFVGCTGLREIYTKYKDPITIDSDVFDAMNYENVILHVPEGCEKYYKVRANWKNFSNIWDDNGKPGEDNDPTSNIRGDVTGDGVVDISDVNEIINIILGKN